MTTPDWRSIDAYLAGTPDSAQQSAVEQWLAEDPSRQGVLQAFRKEASGDSRAVEVDDAWQRMQTRLATVPIAERTMQPPSRWLLRVSAAAAVLVLTVGTAVVWQRTKSGAPLTQVASTTVTVITDAGEHRDLTLPDGSHVTLNAGTTLTYDSSSTGGREVTLEGEAFFDVRHNAKRPFRVRALGGMAEDVGTRFVVRAYREMSQVEVAVAEGAVRLSRLSDDATAKLVSAGMLGQLRADGEPVVVAIPESERYFAWTRGVLVLDGQTLRDAVPRLERWYGVKIVVSDSALARRRVFGRFEGESVQQAMDAIALALGAEQRRTDHTIILTPRGR